MRGVIELRATDFVIIPVFLLSTLYYFSFFMPSSSTNNTPTVLSATTNIESNDDFVSKINSLRLRNNRNGLTVDSGLTKVAQKRAEDMLTNNYYSHTTSNGGDFMNIVEEKGLDPTLFYCENLNMGTGSLTNAISAWQTSKPHNECMNTVKISRVGYSSVQLDDVTYDDKTKNTKIVVAIFGE